MKTIDISVTRTIPATVEQVFDVWIDPKSPGGPWFGAERVLMNAEVDGLFYLGVKVGEKTWPHYGRFLRIERPYRIEYTWVSEGTRGLETVVLFTLVEKDNATEVTLLHSGQADEEMGRQHQQGWTWVVDMLAKRFESQRNPVLS